jgi:hypothetical protein
VSEELMKRCEFPFVQVRKIGAEKIDSSANVRGGYERQQNRRQKGCE